MMHTVVCSSAADQSHRTGLLVWHTGVHAPHDEFDDHSPEQAEGTYESHCIDAAWGREKHARMIDDVPGPLSDKDPQERNDPDAHEDDVPGDDVWITGARVEKRKQTRYPTNQHAKPHCQPDDPIEQNKSIWPRRVALGLLGLLLHETAHSLAIREGVERREHQCQGPKVLGGEIKNVRHDGSIRPWCGHTDHTSRTSYRRTTRDGSCTFW